MQIERLKKAKGACDREEGDDNNKAMTCARVVESPSPTKPCIIAVAMVGDKEEEAMDEKRDSVYAFLFFSSCSCLSFSSLK